MVWVGFNVRSGSFGSMFAARCADDVVQTTRDAGSTVSPSIPIRPRSVRPRGKRRHAARLGRAVAVGVAGTSTMGMMTAMAETAPPDRVWVDPPILAAPGTVGSSSPTSAELPSTVILPTAAGVPGVIDPTTSLLGVPTTTPDGTTVDGTVTTLPSGAPAPTGPGTTTAPTKAASGAPAPGAPPTTRGTAPTGGSGGTPATTAPPSSGGGGSTGSPPAPPTTSPPATAAPTTSPPVTTAPPTTSPPTTAPPPPTTTPPPRGSR